MRKLETISNIVGGVNLGLSMALTAIQVVYFYKLIESIDAQKPPKEKKSKKATLHILKREE